MPKLSNLTPLELQTLQRHEAVITKGINSFVEVGNALSAIRDSRLYRADFSTFEDYCKTKWHMVRQTAFQFINAAKVVENIKDAEISNVSHGLQIEPPKNERQARPLAQLDSKEEQVQAWRTANEKAKLSERPVTAEDVKKAVEEIKQPEKPKEILKDDIEKKTEPKKEVIKRQEPALAMQYAIMAISQLERIRPKDPDKQKALDRVVKWIEENR